MSISFQEFLRQKAEGTNSRDRNRIRGEWLGALNRLLDLIRDWLREADPENLLEIVPYEVERVEERLGIYEAPALKIRLGTDALDILPVGRFSIGPVHVRALFNLPVGREKTDPIAGRVDITDGERKYLLLRFVEAGQDHWFTVDEQSQTHPLDRHCLEMILRNLLS